jgi:glycosyltransferase involved in cell wall biosynthesis
MFDLLKYLKLKESSIHEIIICRSETPISKEASVQRKYLRHAKRIDLKPRVIVSSVPFRAYDGTNRNRGIEIAKADFIVFLDADDLYADSMFELISNAFIASNCDAVLHDYTFDINDFEKINVNNTNFYDLYYPETESLLDFNSPIRKKDSLLVPKLHHAHLSIKKDSLVEPFLDIFPGADTEYCKRLIRNGSKIVYIEEVLSFWNRNRSFRYKVRLARNKLRLKFRLDSKNQL